MLCSELNSELSRAQPTVLYCLYLYPGFYSYTEGATWKYLLNKGPLVKIIDPAKLINEIMNIRKSAAKVDDLKTEDWLIRDCLLSVSRSSYSQHSLSQQPSKRK